MHVVKNIVIYFPKWIQRVGQVYIVFVPLEDQSYGVMMCVQRINLWTNPTGHVQRTNPMGICYMHKGPIHDACYNEPDACTEDQSYRTVHVPMHGFK